MTIKNAITNFPNSLNIYRLTSEHALTRVLGGSSVLGVKVNLEYSLYFRIITFSNHKKIYGCDEYYAFASEIIFHHTPRFFL